jgi:hypothetical protein
LKLPNVKREQLRLFAEPLGNHGTVRTTLGDFAERLVAKLLNGQRYKTDSRCKYCPDVKAMGKFFEVKAVGRTRESLIYEGRLEKDLLFSQTNELYYVFCCHSVDSKVCRDSFELQCMFMATLGSIVVAPFESVYEAAMMSEVTRLNSSYGHSDTNKVYGAGYRLPMKRLTKFSHLRLSINSSEELFV